MIEVKLTAAEISSSLIYGVRLNFFMPPMMQQAIQSGRLIHSRLGYTNSKTFSRYFTVNNENVLIVGMPDRVDENFVYELKTYHSAKSRETNLKVAQIQIQVYSFLTGLKQGRIIMYDVGLDKITDEIEVVFDAKLLKGFVKKALKLKELTQKFQKEYKVIQDR